MNAKGYKAGNLFVFGVDMDSMYVVINGRLSIKNLRDTMLHHEIYSLVQTYYLRGNGISVSLSDHYAILYSYMQEKNKKKGYGSL